jgi:hypothetical protein
MIKSLLPQFFCFEASCNDISANINSLSEQLFGFAMHCQAISLLHNRTGPFNDYTKLQLKYLSSLTRGIATATKKPRLSPGSFVLRKFSCRLCGTKLIILCHMVPLALDKHIVYYYPASEILSHVKPSFLAA